MPEPYNAGAGPAPASSSDWGLLFLRVTGSLLLLIVHGLPKVLNYTQELTVIEDPLHLGRWLTLNLAIFAEVLCPLLIMLGLFTRLACLPIVVLLLVSMLIAHPEWSLAEGQFGWLLLIIFMTLLITGPGQFSLSGQLQARWAHPFWQL